MLYCDFLRFSAEFCGETELETGLNSGFAGVKAWQCRYLAWMVPWGDSWGVSKRVEAGKVRETVGIVG